MADITQVTAVLVADTEYEGNYEMIVSSLLSRSGLCQLQYAISYSRHFQPQVSSREEGAARWRVLIALDGMAPVLEDDAMVLYEAFVEQLKASRMKPCMLDERYCSLRKCS